MTCIVGIIDDGTISMGADSQVTQGWTKQSIAPSMPKLIRKDELLIGVCGHLRAINVLRHNFTAPPHHPADQDTLTYIALTLVDAMRAAFKAAGIAKISDSVEENGGSSFLIGYRGRLFEISHDWSTLETGAEYVSIGSGSEYATGSLFTSKGKPKERILTALTAASTFNMGCSAPFTVEELA